MVNGGVGVVVGFLVVAVELGVVVGFWVVDVAVPEPALVVGEPVTGPELAVGSRVLGDGDAVLLPILMKDMTRAMAKMIAAGSHHRLPLFVDEPWPGCMRASARNESSAAGIRKPHFCIANNKKATAATRQTTPSPNKSRHFLATASSTGVIAVVSVETGGIVARLTCVMGVTGIGDAAICVWPDHC